MAGEVLSLRALNRALLERQGLLERSSAAPIEIVERLVGLQAQVPLNPYVALWSRIERFDPEELSRALVDRDLVRATQMRATIHLLSSDDCIALYPLMASVRARRFRGSFGGVLPDAQLEQVIEAGRELIAERPRTRSELSALLGPRWPDVDPIAVGLAVLYHLPLIQVTPRGLWGQRAQPRWTLAENWIERRGGTTLTRDEVVLRYLAAFGPATAADARVWSGLDGLRETFERLKPGLRTSRDEQGRELFDVQDGPLPDPATPAPPRFLPHYDNVMLSHDDRSRVVEASPLSVSMTNMTWSGSLLVDGFLRGLWEAREDDHGAVLNVSGFGPRPTDPAGTTDALEVEGLQLLELVWPRAAARRVRLGQ